jgi:HPt (histidine-containing phosphotransfer) domain-containing protein
VAILDADKEGFLRSAWALIQMTGRAARNIGGEVIMYADTVTMSMRAAIDETNRRRAVQEAYNRDHGIEPRTIVKEIHDINDRLRAVGMGAGTNTDQEARDRALSGKDRSEIEALVGRLEASMRAAARELEFERAAALRDEIQAIRLRVLEEDASLVVGRAAEAAAAASGVGGTPAPTPASGRPRPGARAGRGRGARRTGMGDGDAPPPLLEVVSVEVLPAPEEPLAAIAALGADGVSDADGWGPTEGTAADWLPGIRDEHEDMPLGGGLDGSGPRRTWDRTVTPNVIRRTGTRPPRRRR